MLGRETVRSSHLLQIRWLCLWNLLEIWLSRRISFFNRKPDRKEWSIDMENISERKEMLQQIMTLLEQHFGKKCEIVLHDFTKEHDHTIVDIRNGQITGRKIGGCATNLELEIMNGTVPAKDQFNYITYAPDGRILKSSSIYFHNQDGEAIGSLCLNLDITDTVYFEKCLRQYNSSEEHALQDEPREIFTPNVNELLDRLIKQSLQKYGKSPKMLTKEEKMQFIADLDAKGAFVITKSSDRVYSLLGISRYTFYTYLDMSRKKRKNEMGVSDNGPK